MPTQYLNPSKRLVVQMIVWFTVASLLPLGLALYTHFYQSASILGNLASVNLYAVAQRQSADIKRFLRSAEQSALLLAQTPTVIECLEQLNAQEANPSDIVQQFDPVLERFISKLNLENIFLVRQDGLSVYDTQRQSIEKNGLSVRHALNTVFERTMMVFAPQISDFSLQQDEDKPVLLFACPVLHNQKLLGVVAIQINSDVIYNIVNNAYGLGETGETIIAQQKGSKIIFVNAPRHKPDLAFCEDTLDSENQNYALSLAMHGERGFGRSIDYRGKAVLAAWEYLPRLRWGVILKQDMQEVLLPVHQLRKLALSVTGFALLLAMIIGTVATQRITQPILTLTRLAIRIAQGDLSDIRLPKLPDNEIGLLASAIATMAYNLKDLVSKVKSSSNQIVRLYGATSQASKTQTDAALRAVQASAKISEVAQDIATTAKDLFSTIEAINQTIQKTAFQAEFSRNRLKIIASTIHEIVKAKDMIGEHLSELKDKALSIQSIFGSVVKIADRTNILSLNTAIEAQQLGKNSSGLRIIAREIKQLADQTCMSSLQIEKKIQEMDSAVRLGIAGMDQFSEKVNQETQEITNASVYLNQLIEAVAKLPHHIEKAFARMQFQIQSAEAIEESIERLCASAHQAAIVLQETNQNLEDLNKSSGTFQKEIARFKT